MRPRRYHSAALPGVALALFITLFAFLSLAYTITPWSGQRFQMWPDHYVLLVDSDVSGKHVVQRLHSVDIDDVVSKWSSTVSFQGFEGMKSVVVADIPTRFAELDPRVDPYMRHVSELFVTYGHDRQGGSREYATFYLPADEGILTTHIRLALAFRGLPDRWRLAGWDWLGSGVATAVFLLGALALVVVSRRHRIWLAAASLPLLVVAIVDGVAGLAPALLILLLWCHFFELAAPAAEEFLRYRRSSVEPVELAQRGASLGIGILAATVLYGIEAGSNALWLALVAEVCLGGAFLSRILVRTHAQEHRVFLPVPIMRRYLFRRSTRRTAYRDVIPWFLAILIAVPLVYGASVNRPDLRIVQPEPRPGIADVSYESVHRLWEQSARQNVRSGPPTYADYVAHMAYQQAFLHNRRYEVSDSYEVPDYGTHVRISRFSRDGEGLAKRSDVVMSYDAQWYNNVQGRAVTGSIPGLLASPGRATGVVRRAPQQLYWQPLHRVRQIVLVLVVLVPLYILHAPLRFESRAGAGYYTVRRKRQVA